MANSHVTHPAKPDTPELTAAYMAAVTAYHNLPDCAVLFGSDVDPLDPAYTCRGCDGRIVFEQFRKMYVSAPIAYVHTGFELGAL